MKKNIIQPSFLGQRSATQESRKGTFGTTRCVEAGSIMLEVVAVLALMGVMGAMLFRQIYQRNQELHNIQMASEIRTVKEAFSAYIQANRTSLLADCPIPGTTDGCDRNDVCACTDVIDENFYADVAEYLPDGWFTGDTLPDAYTLSLWTYLQEDIGKRVIYGVVVPTEGTLPSSGWNFRRAARVALLIGADGGAYGPNITNDIAGTLGSWQIAPQDIIDDGCLSGGAKVNEDKCNTYVATTGIDVFSPEYEAPEGKVRIPEPWSLKLNDLHAYNYFSVGNSGTGNCYTTIGHNIYSGTPESLGSDEITKSLSDACKPLFWVGAQNGGGDANTGNVYVATDLKIGDIEGGAHNEALTLTKEGVIRQKDGLTIDKDGRIIAKDDIGNNAVGELPANDKYVLDLAHISTMGDIRLTSRGGVKLSEILPNYILKGQKEVSHCNGTSEGASATDCKVEKPNCPVGYQKSLAIIPTSWNKKDLQIDISDLAGKLQVNGTDVEEKNANSKYDVENDSGLCVQVDGSGITLNAIGSGSDDWKIKLGKRNGSTCEYDSTAMAIVQTYCVYNNTGTTVEDMYGTEPKCQEAGLTWVGSHCSKGTHTSSGTCASDGGTWITAGYCKNVYDVVNINNHVPNDQKAAICKAAGYNWNAGTCSVPE